jgi:putative PIN family toxin of toxin-antitoxin system
MRVVLDTNVFVSAVLGKALALVLETWQSGRFVLVVSDEIVREYHRVLRRQKFGLTDEIVDGIIGYVFRRAEFVLTGEPLSVVKEDPADNKFLEAALAGEASLIVSGDRHLLHLETYQGIPIITARAFLDRLANHTPRLL